MVNGGCGLGKTPYLAQTAVVNGGCGLSKTRTLAQTAVVNGGCGLSNAHNLVQTAVVKGGRGLIKTTIWHRRRWWTVAAASVKPRSGTDGGGKRWLRPQ